MVTPNNTIEEKTSSSSITTTVKTSNDADAVINILGSITSEDISTILTKWSDDNHSVYMNDNEQQQHTESKVSSGHGKVVLILLHGSWNGYEKKPSSITGSTTNDADLFLQKVSKELEKDTVQQPLEEEVHDTNTRKVDDFLLSGEIRHVSIIVNENEESLNFCVDRLKTPSTLPALAVVYLSSLVGEDDTPTSNCSISSNEINFPMNYIGIDSTTLHSYIVGSSSNHSASIMEYNIIVESIKKALNPCINEWSNNDNKRLLDLRMNRKRKTVDTDDIDNDNKDANKKIANNEKQIRIFISGDRSQVGKSSICLGLLGSLLNLGYKPQELAYTKPATQCEKPTLVSKFCLLHNISAQPIGPLVYYKGFTRQFLSGHTHSTKELLTQISQAVDAVSIDKKIVIIDGVGYPSVGSICGTDNASVASVCGVTTTTTTTNNNTTTTTTRRLPAFVLIVGKSGVGDAVDSFNINKTYFEAKHVPVLGVIFNRFPLSGYYSIENCQCEIQKYFTNANNSVSSTRTRKYYHPFGFLPEIPALSKLKDDEEDELEKEQVDGGSNNTVSNIKEASSSSTTMAANEFISTFQKHVNVKSILNVASKLMDQLLLSNTASTTNEDSNDNMVVVETEDDELIQISNKKLDMSSSDPISASSNKPTILTRDQIEETAKAAGAVASSA